jgi:hypothetical protein
MGEGGAAKDGPGLFTSLISWLMSLFVCGCEIHLRKRESI